MLDVRYIVYTYFERRQFTAADRTSRNAVRPPLPIPHPGETQVRACLLIFFLYTQWENISATHSAANFGNGAPQQASVQCDTSPPPSHPASVQPPAPRLRQRIHESMLSAARRRIRRHRYEGQATSTLTRAYYRLYLILPNFLVFITFYYNL